MVIPWAIKIDRPVVVYRFSVKVKVAYIVTKSLLTPEIRFLMLSTCHMINII